MDLTRSGTDMLSWRRIWPTSTPRLSSSCDVASIPQVYDDATRAGFAGCRGTGTRPPTDTRYSPGGYRDVVPKKAGIAPGAGPVGQAAVQRHPGAALQRRSAKRWEKQEFRQRRRRGMSSPRASGRAKAETLRGTEWLLRSDSRVLPLRFRPGTQSRSRGSTRSSHPLGQPREKRPKADDHDDATPRTVSTWTSMQRTSKSTSRNTWHT